MSNISETTTSGSAAPGGTGKGSTRRWLALLVVIWVAGAAITFALRSTTGGSEPAVVSVLPGVSVCTPLKRDLDARLQFLGQFSAVELVELRAQVGGILTQIGFKDGDIVQKGDLLFVIDPTPYQIKLNEATARLETARTRLELASNKLARAELLKPKGGMSVEAVDERTAEQHAAQAAISDAQAVVDDAKFDLDHCRITAPFTGRIGSHLISTGNLVAGSRAGGGTTTLLATLVSVDPIYLNFDMSEADYLLFLREREKGKKSPIDRVDIALGDETKFSREGRLDFVDNVLDRSSGTIHARATVPNKDLLLTPGGFARIRLPLSQPTRQLLVPDAAVLADQSERIVLVVGADEKVTPKVVKVGDLRGGLRVILSGLEDTDKVIVDGIPTVRPGMKVATSAGTIQFDTNRD